MGIVRIVLLRLGRRTFRHHLHDDGSVARTSTPAPPLAHVVRTLAFFFAGFCSSASSSSSSSSSKSSSSSLKNVSRPSTRQSWFPTLSPRKGWCIDRRVAHQIVVFQIFFFFHHLLFFLHRCFSFHLLLLLFHGCCDIPFPGSRPTRPSTPTSHLLRPSDGQGPNQAYLGTWEPPHEPSLLLLPSRFAWQRKETLQETRMCNGDDGWLDRQPVDLGLSPNRPDADFFLEGKWIRLRKEIRSPSFESMG